MSERKLYLNMYWHMHQPDYRNLNTGEYVFPWTYLHALKDYSDMAYHLEQQPEARVSFNFVPILLSQLLDYADQCQKQQWRDPLLGLLVTKDLAEVNPQECQLIIDSCFKAHHDTMLYPFPDYQCLLRIYQSMQPITQSGQFHYLSAQYKADLLVWYHLAWIGESIRRENKTIQDLMQKGSLFTFEDRKSLMAVICTTLSDIIPRYQALLQRGQIEVSTTPYHHPILPLLLDFNSTKDAMPEALLPQHTHYAGGEARANRHIQTAHTFHMQVFGNVPLGMWPAEGAVSYATLDLLAKNGVKWAASGQAVLVNSLNRQGLPTEQASDYLYKPYQIDNGEQQITCFFRDDALSDKIGFEYAKLHATEAVQDFVSTLENILNNPQFEHQPAIVSVILDGENAWEHYPYNGYYFLTELYQALSQHAHIQMTTFSDILKLQMEGVLNHSQSLTVVNTGSWVYGSLSTWIGDPAKNHAWDLLCAAKNVYDAKVTKLSKEQQIACEEQLSVCESSDWFWWVGDYNNADSVESFDRLFRANLINLYQLLGAPVPEQLHQAISSGGGDAENSGTMRRGQA